MSSVAVLPRLACTASNVINAVDTTWNHCLNPATRQLVSSACATGSPAKRSLTSSMNEPRPSVACPVSPASHPVDTGAPTRSDKISATRAIGR
jgi:hypothetical protein